MNSSGSNHITQHIDSLRLAVIAESPLARAGLGALLTPLADGRPIATRGFDLLRDIGAQSSDNRRVAALEHTQNIDAVIVVLDDATPSADEATIADGIVALTQGDVPVMLLLADSDDTVSQAAEWLARSVRAILPLDAPVEELHTAVRAIVAGLTVIESGVAVDIARRGTRARKSSRQAALTGGSAPSLTGREREVLSLLAEGHATKTIARELGISAHTVKAHVESIFEKLGATTRAEAVAIGVRRGAVML